MGAKVVAYLTLLCMLYGYSRIVERSCTYVTGGVYARGGTMWENGMVRSRTITDTQALQCVIDDRGISLSPGEFAYCTGTLYSLSNYRELLLESGYRIESEVETSDVLDTTLSGGSDRVRLTYQSSGSVRILFEGLGGATHILLEGVQQ